MSKSDAQIILAEHGTTGPVLAMVTRYMAREGGFGSFGDHLMEAMIVADTTNLENLRKGFPGLVGALKVWREHGTQGAREIVEAARD